MIELNNGCSCSEFTVTPKDWDQPGAYKTDAWFITYRFVDPLFATRYPKGKLVTIKKGINKKGTLEAKRDAVRKVMKDHLGKLQRGYNPITNTTLSAKHYYNKPPRELPPATPKPDNNFILSNDTVQIEVTPDLLKVAQQAAREKENELYTIPLKSDMLKITILHAQMPFIDALWGAYWRSSGNPNHLADLRSCIRAMHRAAFVLNYHQLPISRINAQVIMHCFEFITYVNPKFTPNSRNRYRSHLYSFIKQLRIPGAVAENFIEVIPVLPVDKALPNIPENEEIDRIDVYLKEKDYNFWRFINIFFASGARITEMMKIKYDDVNPKKQEFYIWVLKGGKRQYTKPIAKSVLHLWREVLEECRNYAASVGIPEKVGNVVLFSEGIKPAFYSIRPDQMSRRWTRYVKKQLGINKGLYKLKHLYSDRLAQVFGLKHAQKQNSHESEQTTLIYTVGEEARRLQDLKRSTIQLKQSGPIPLNLEPVSRRMVDLGQIWPIQDEFTQVFCKFMALLRGRTSITFRSPAYFGLKVVREKDNVAGDNNCGVLYSFRQGYETGGTWLPINTIGFIYIAPQNDAGGDITYGDQLFPCSYQQQALGIEEHSIILKDDKVYDIASDLAAAHKKLAEHWLPMLESRYISKIPAPGAMENSTFIK